MGTAKDSSFLKQIEPQVQKELYDRQLKYAEIGVWVASFLIPVWSIVDYIYAPDLLMHFMTLRILIPVIYVVSLILTKRNKWPVTLSNYLVYLGTLSLVFYLIFRVPESSIMPYLLGNCTVYAAASLLFIWPGRNTLFVAIAGLIMAFIVYYLREDLGINEFIAHGGMILISMATVAVFLGYNRYNFSVRDIRAMLVIQNANDKLISSNNEIQLQKEEISNQRDELYTKSEDLDKAYRKIKDSILYAQRIQSGLLGDPSFIIKQFKDAFIFHRPKDIVSGDYYWYHELDDYQIMVVADCTGHGVSGAFMTVIGCALLNEIVKGKQIHSPALILGELDELIIESLHKEQYKETHDGMDMAVIVIDRKNNKLYFSGAKSPLYMVRDGIGKEIKGSKHPLGSVQLRKKKRLGNLYFEKTIDYKKGDRFYLFSDGYQDQFGGPQNRKYLRHRFRALIDKVSTLTMDQQKELLQKNFDSWKINTPQTDDVLVVGIRIK